MSYQQPYDPSQQFNQGQPQQQYYPQQPMMQPQKKKHTGRNVFLGCGGAFVALIVIIIIIVVASAANAPKAIGTVVNTTATTGNTQATTAPATQSTFKVGQVVSVANTWQITVLSAKTSAGSQFNTPQKAGDLFMLITVSAKNISGQSQTMSSIGQWNLQDSTGQKYNIGIDTDAGAGLDGPVANGMPIKGALVYEVPKTVKSFTLSFQNDITSRDQTFLTIAV